MAGYEASSSNDITSLFLKHQDIMRSFWKEFTSLPSDTSGVYENLRQDLMHASCLQQKIQSTVASEIFYPSIRGCATAGVMPIDEILEKYAATDQLLREVESGHASNPDTCARYAAWGDALDQIFLQEAAHVLPEVTPLKLHSLQARLEQRRAELLDELDGQWCGQWGESLLWNQRKPVDGERVAR